MVVGGFFVSFKIPHFLGKEKRFAHVYFLSHFNHYKRWSSNLFLQVFNKKVCQSTYTILITMNMNKNI